MIRVLAILICFLLGVGTVSAHSEGEPFFQINALGTSEYPITITSVDEFVIPQDLGEQLYLVNQPIEFEINTDEVSLSPETLQTLRWDFGNGDKASGAKNTYTYTKTGSYILSIYEANGSLFQSVMLHVIPNIEYDMPQAVIEVNDLDKSYTEADFNKNIKLSADKSTGKITEYLWDLGNGNSSKEKEFSYKFDPSSSPAPILLRVKDENGLISDTYISLSHKEQASVLGTSIPAVMMVIGGLGLISTLLYFFLKKKSR